MDGSVAGRGCLALMVRVVYDGRALPLCWLVVKAPKSQFPEQTHRTLLAQVHALLPPDAEVTFLDDGEFDGVDLQAVQHTTGWRYVCCTASNILVTACDVTFHVADVALSRGQLLAVTPAWMTARRYGPVALLFLWEEGCERPLYLVSNLVTLPQVA